jgi:VanZ family protein
VPRNTGWLVIGVVAAIIVYGSLYPLQFRVPPHGLGPVATFLASAGQLPGRGDAIANILLYVPFGFFLLPNLPLRGRGAVCATSAAGMLLSFGMELAQYYVPGRVTTLDDVVTNTLGALLGALAATAAGENAALPLVGQVFAEPVPALLVLAWLGYRLYPYVPTINLHKYWYALKPIVLTPSLTGFDLFRQTAIWLTLYALIESIARRWRSAWLAPAFALGVLGAEVVITRTTLRLAEPVGAALAWLLWLPLLPLWARPRALIVGLLLSAYVVALRLEPFSFLPGAHDFGWVPFLSLMRGSLRVDTLAFLEKFFLYGSMVYLFGRAFGHRLTAALFVGALLFTTSWAERWLPGRSAEITDTLMSLIIGMIFVLLPAPTATPRRLTAQERRTRDWQRAQARELGVKVERSP